MADAPRLTSFTTARPSLADFDRRLGGAWGNAPHAKALADVAPAEAAVIIEAEVFEVLPGFGLAHLGAGDGRVYGINRRIHGISSFDTLHEGERYRCEVLRKFDRVVHAQLIG